MLARIVNEDPEPGAPLNEAFAAIRAEVEVSTDYPADALAEAQQAVASVQLPDRDETAVPFFTIDPPGSTDLDQAMFLERDGDGYRVRYAIADVPAFVTPGGALDRVTRERTQTLYFPDQRVPLHPAVISEDKGSLLPDQERGAFVWDVRLDGSGQQTSAEVYLARVRSVARLDYDGVQASIDDGSAPQGLMLLKTIGELRIALERERGGADLPIPAQEVERDDNGDYHLRLRPPVTSEDWNSQISLLTGMAAAGIMLDAKVGILRTMPEAPQFAVDRFRGQARALGVTWPKGLAYGEFLRTLDRNDPHHLALMYAAGSLFRGAGYTVFDGSVPDQTMQAAVGAPYAHVTAPLRRLVDRFGLVICESICAGRPVPDWARQSLPELPKIMAAGDQLAHKVDRMCTDAVEVAVMSHHVGDTFAATVVARTKTGVEVQLTDRPVIATLPGDAAPGDSVQVRVGSADLSTRTLEFALV
ncbi:exoribonuclease R [Branchiibius hedensis]|uniref:Exoribonuclease R n=1 Tax=Branchiibius hedensis TaxID=672460 RepID=A0A2Y8ZQW9_9MICO|nr:RNB domain-containing ribonuclease [Branchiibius hedensis]PWJ25451.1 exoribonuclease R [Branchiibius hedensis]SSA34264.1 Exoribonuclease R [Branchiibius hedensis]